MDESLLANEIQEFINATIDDDVSKLALQKNKFSTVDFTDLVPLS